MKIEIKEFCARNKKKLVAFAIAAVVIPVGVVLGMKQLNKSEDEVIYDEIESGDETEEITSLEEGTEEVQKEDEA